MSMKAWFKIFLVAAGLVGPARGGPAAIDRAAILALPAAFVWGLLSVVLSTRFALGILASIAALVVGAYFVSTAARSNGRLGMSP